MQNMNAYIKGLQTEIVFVALYIIFLNKSSVETNIRQKFSQRNLHKLHVHVRT